MIHSGIKVWDLASGTCLTKHDGTRHLIGIQPAIPASRTSAGVIASRDEVEATGDVKTPEDRPAVIGGRDTEPQPGGGSREGGDQVCRACDRSARQLEKPAVVAARGWDDEADA